MPEAQPVHVLKGIRLTEKTAFLAEAKNVYAFKVPLGATKHDIKKAVEAAFGVRVVKVNTQTRVGQPRRFKMQHSMTGDIKQALVKLHDEDRISLY
ncbi:MAG: 50S ribosomal protein L23 [Planctomycetes bacterium]|nr:50S ribosomal protein L23 [Planctomycetota bacterium]